MGWFLLQLALTSKVVMSHEPDAPPATPDQAVNLLVGHNLDQIRQMMNVNGEEEDTGDDDLPKIRSSPWVEVTEEHTVGDLPPEAIHPLGGIDPKDLTAIFRASLHEGDDGVGVGEDEDMDAVEEGSNRNKRAATSTFMHPAALYKSFFRDQDDY
ncbi:uncharacterized protein LOC121853448 isoform X2 [Homarus americanus]|nr:uncharacterized protein LOC121853448 isoform X2 [Homarus americanus]